MEHDATPVALGADEAFEGMLNAKLGNEQTFGDRTDTASSDLDRDPARRAELGDFRFMLQTQVERRQARRGKSQSTALDDRRRQNQSVRQAAAS